MLYIDAKKLEEEKKKRKIESDGRITVAAETTASPPKD